MPALCAAYVDSAYSSPPRRPIPFLDIPEHHRNAKTNIPGIHSPKQWLPTLCLRWTPTSSRATVRCGELRSWSCSSPHHHHHHHHPRPCPLRSSPRKTSRLAGACRDTTVSSRRLRARMHRSHRRCDKLELNSCPNYPQTSPLTRHRLRTCELRASLRPRARAHRTMAAGRKVLLSSRLRRPEHLQTRCHR